MIVLKYLKKRIYDPEESPIGERRWCYKCRMRDSLVHSSVNPERNLCIICYLKENKKINRKKAIKRQLEYQHEKPLEILARREKYHEEQRNKWWNRLKRFLKYKIKMLIYKFLGK